VCPDQDVLEHGHRPEELDVLERARDALTDDRVRCRAEDRLPVELHAPRVRLVEPRDDVERGRLAGAVRPDEARDLAFLDVERHAVEGDDAAEAERDVLDREEGHRSENPNRAPCTLAIGHGRLAGDEPGATRPDDVRPTATGRRLRTD
jgi:hypothetical protein